MARVRNNQGHRNKTLNIFMRPFLEQENTQEREAFLQARETIKPLQDATWKLAEKIVRRHYTDDDVKKAYYMGGGAPRSQAIQPGREKIVLEITMGNCKMNYGADKKNKKEKSCKPQAPSYKLDSQSQR